jgi:hypothetical protein
VARIRPLALFALLIALAVPAVADAQDPPFRPPAVPLVTHTPYFSVWATGDALTDGPTRHWTGAEQSLTGLVRIDGRAYRLIGPRPADVAAMTQTAMRVWPLRTEYDFEAAGVRLTLTFLSAALPWDLERLSRPVSYIVITASSSDGRAHDVRTYLDVTAQWAVNTTNQAVTWGRLRAKDLDVMRIGTVEQAVLARSGDNLRVDWGHLYLATPTSPDAASVIGGDRETRARFVESGALAETDDFREPRTPDDGMPVLAVSLSATVAATGSVSHHVLVAYDELFSIEYFGRRLRPYWRRAGKQAIDLLRDAERDYGWLSTTAPRVDERLMADFTRVGGARYARVAALAWRQALAAHSLVADADGTLLYFSKENFSNGCVGTVDVTYPSAPLFLAYNPALLEAQIRPVLDYARSPRWRFPFAPHDLGRYPLANGQVYGGREETEENQMPVEESGNLLLLVTALTRASGSAALAQAYWPELTKWAEYLREKGLDPDNQLSTDDFAGHLAHNTNLSLKAILALRGYAALAEKTGRSNVAATYRTTVSDMARRWEQMAADGDHYSLTFDRKGTWSQKYNLVWDALLGFNLFPASIARSEIAYYKRRQNAYGLPLDNRATYAKLDWIVWTATLAPDPEDFAALIAPVEKFLQETPDRVPMSDWYDTVTGKKVGFQARSVVGGVFIKLLADPDWSRWVPK